MKPITKEQKDNIAIFRRTPHIGAKKDRGLFWQYCKRTEASARIRATKSGLPFNITAYDIDELLVKQQWRCAVSNILLRVDGGGTGRDPLAPSLDRIVPKKGYVVGNLRVVTSIVNTALNEWGLEALMALFDAIYMQHREHL